jgi:hypothetical protein
MIHNIRWVVRTVGEWDQRVLQYHNGHEWQDVPEGSE